MPFNVTQCPACESTFNTNSRVLAAAAGRVRCGACLNVFEAIDNFLVTEQADSDSAHDDSVFVGNNPQEFFDPSSFLTRSALKETHNTEAERTGPDVEQALHQDLEQSEVVSEDFFATVAEELQDREERPAPDTAPAEDAQQQPDQSEEIEASASDSSPADEAIDTIFEDEILGAFEEQGIEHPKDQISDEAAPEPHETGNESEPATDESDSFLSMGLSASISFDPYGSPEVRIGETESKSPTDDATSSEPLSAEVAANEIEVEVEVEKALYEEPEQENEPEAEQNSDPLPELSPGETEVVDDEPPSHETYDDEAGEVQDELEAEVVPENVETPIQSSQGDNEEVDEESTEAIRARALEAELRDEEALEVIPEENLAALGSMSSPVEFLARKESRILRSTLLFFAILLLGGLLSAQYLYQRMELYSQLTQLRPLYEFACAQFGCELPEFSDIDAIRSENLSVQTHPTLENGLMVNTVIRNTAAFEQRFPVLILSFNSAENSIVALREFSPAEYLDPQLRSRATMPAMTPVQIDLALMDPGPGAVNYTLAFRWP